MVHRFLILSMLLKSLSNDVSLSWLSLSVTIDLVLLVLMTSVMFTKVPSTFTGCVKASESLEGASSLIADAGEEGREATTLLYEGAVSFAFAT